MQRNIVLETQHLKKNFGPVQAVEDVSLEVRHGEVFGFLGPNGAGKTTTIGMILSLVRPSAGSVRLFGETVTPGHNRSLKKVGALIGSPALVPYLTARQNMELIARLHPGLPDNKVQTTLERVGLEGAANRKAGTFSSGMKQRLGLGMALLHDPELLILDEPTNGMDPAGMREMRVLLRSLSDQGVTVFLSSHLLHEIEQVCDRVAVLKAGRVIVQGSVTELMGDTQIVKLRVDSPAEVAGLLGSLNGVQQIIPNGAYVTVKGASSQQIIRHLASHGIAPSEVTNEKPDLESLFLELTGPEPAL